MDNYLIGSHFAQDKLENWQGLTMDVAFIRSGFDVFASGINYRSCIIY